MAKASFLRLHKTAQTAATPLPDFAVSAPKKPDNNIPKVQAMYEFLDADGVQIASRGGEVRALKGQRFALRSAFMVADMVARDALTFERAGQIETVKVKTLAGAREGQTTRNAMRQAVVRDAEIIERERQNLDSPQSHRTKMWCAQQIFMERT